MTPQQSLAALFYGINTIPKNKKRIMVHCGATGKTWPPHFDAFAAVEEFRVWHVKDRGWSDVAYAAAIDSLGIIAPGRDLNNNDNVFDDTGAGAAGHNSDVIHVVLTGGKGSKPNDQADDHYTKEAQQTLANFLVSVLERADHEMEILGHNDVTDAKACPGFKVKPWWARWKEKDAAVTETENKTQPPASNWAVLIQKILSVFGGKKK